VSERRRVRVTGATPTRLDACLRALAPELSRRLVRTLVADGAVLVNGRPARKGTRVSDGDVVELPAVAPLAAEPDLPLRVLYEDPNVIAIDKPGGVPGHALDPRQRGTMAAALLARYAELGTVADPLAAGLVHRLDTGTSGVLVAARSPHVHRELRAAFRRHEVTKRYAAVVVGTPVAGTVVDAALAHDPHDRRRMRVARATDRAWPARTVIVAVEPHGENALVEVEIRTGVTHQVRVHLAELGTPIVGDALYGTPSAVLAPRRHALHARRLDVPSYGLRIDAAIPDDLLGLVRAGS
jgi:23S rRNA pseudouridine1911/1915/1917 synthase